MKLRLRVPVISRRHEEPLPIPSEQDCEARADFFRVLLGQDEADSLVKPCVEWYGRFLESRFRGAWPRIVREALRNLNKQYNEPQPGEIGVVYRLMSEVAEQLLRWDRRREGGELSMVGIVDKLDNLHLLERTDEERAIQNQLVFAAVGWLSELAPFPKC